MQSRLIYSLLLSNGKRISYKNTLFIKRNCLCNATNLASTSSTSKKTDTKAFLKDIVKEYSIKNRIFLIPWADYEAIENIQRPFEQLLNTGIKQEFLKDACLTNPELFKALTRHGSQVVDTLDILQKTTGQSYENVMRFFAKWIDELLAVSPQRVQAAMDVFLSRGIIAGTQLIRLINRCPAILYSEEPIKMCKSLEYISSFFHAEEIKLMIMASPQICLRSVNELELRYEYIYFHMGIESREFPECACWIDLELEEIMMRHKFLKKTGQYILPDPKRPQFKMENPKMFQIFDTDDHKFATQVARVTLQEWLVFKDLYTKELRESDKERPYDRVKPWLRKAYERQRVHSVEKTEGTLEN